MIFNGVNNQTVEMKIVDYEFPEMIEGDWDGNWLNIYLNVQSELGNWEIIDPVLTTWDIRVIIDWLYLLSENKIPDYLDLRFIEPNISFILLNKPTDEIKKIKIKFNYEFEPTFAKKDVEYFVNFEADNQELKKLATDLDNELAKYPERSPNRYDRSEMITIDVLENGTIKTLRDQ